MGKSVLIIGESGSGKSSSIRTLNPKSTMIFTALGKKLPFRGSNKNYSLYNKETNPEGNLVHTSSSKVISAWLRHISNKMPHITTVVIDDSTFLSIKELDRRREEVGYNKFSDIAHDFLEITEIANTLRDDLNIYFIYHIKKEGDGILEEQTIKALSSGKLIDEKYGSVEAQFEIVLLACKIAGNDDQIEYKFKTRDKNSTTKTPIGLFEDQYIDNDLNFVDQSIRKYYNED